MQSAAPQNFVFDDPRLRMTVMGRMAVRALGLVAEVVAVVAAFAFAFSDVPWVKWLGIFFLLFIVDRLAHFGEGDRPLTELSSGAGEGRRAGVYPHTKRALSTSGTDARSGVGVNLAPYLAPKAFAAIERAHDRSVIAHDNFFLALARELLGRPDTEECLRRLDVSPDEFKGRVEEFLESEVGNGNGNGGALTVLVVRACEIARDAGHRFIEPRDLFSALPATDDPTITRLFHIFQLTADDF